jgi:phenylacetate-CoA ligase
MATAATLAPSDPYPSFLDPIETASRADLARHQEAALVAKSAYAFARAPLITETWMNAGVSPADIRSTADFIAKAPFITKDSVREFRDRNNDPAGGMGHYGPGEIVQVGTTSGTTGDPTPVPGGRRTPAEETFARDLWHLGLRPGDFHAHVMFTFRGGHRRRALQEMGIGEINFSMDPREMPRFCEASRRYRPTTVAIMPNPLLNVLEQHFERTGEDPADVFRSYKGALFGGEPLSARLAKVAQSWGLEIYENTSLGDVCGATECRARAGMHAYEDIAFIECIDPLGTDPVPDGEVGELVDDTGRSLHAADPLSHRRSGDDGP